MDDWFDTIKNIAKVATPVLSSLKKNLWDSGAIHKLVTGDVMGALGALTP